MVQHSNNFISRSIWNLLDANTVGRSWGGGRDKKCSPWNILNQKHSSCTAYPYNLTQGFRVTLQFTAKLLLLQWVIVFILPLPLATCKWWQVKSFLSSLQNSAVAGGLIEIPLQQERLKTDFWSFPDSYGHLLSLFLTRNPFIFGKSSLTDNVCDGLPRVCSSGISLTRPCLLFPTQ